MNADGSDVRQLTNEPGYDGGPFISPDGSWVIFRSDRKKEGFLQIHAIGIDGKNDVALTDNVGVNWAPYWHPTKPYIIWTGADHSDPKARPNYDLWLMKYEEQGRQAGARPDHANHRQPGRRRAAGLLARRQAIDVDQQPHRRSRQPVVHRRFQAAGIRSCCSDKLLRLQHLDLQLTHHAWPRAETRCRRSLLQGWSRPASGAPRRCRLGPAWRPAAPRRRRDRPRSTCGSRTPWPAPRTPGQWPRAKEFRKRGPAPPVTPHVPCSRPSATSPLRPRCRTPGSGRCSTCCGGRTARASPPACSDPFRHLWLLRPSAGSAGSSICSTLLAVVYSAGAGSIVRWASPGGETSPGRMLRTMISAVVRVQRSYRLRFASGKDFCRVAIRQFHAIVHATGLVRIG